MSKAVIIYGSTTGNTESTAGMIENVLRANELEAVVKDVVNTPVEELNNDYDLILLGSSTWGEDEIELQEDFAEFYEEMGSITLNGKKAAIFGCGDSSYEYFCGAVDAIEEKVKEIGGTLITESLKIDGDPMDAKDEIIEWAATVAEKMK
jgi:flavodoxin short chain